MGRRRIRVNSTEHKAARQSFVKGAVRPVFQLCLAIVCVVIIAQNATAMQALMRLAAQRRDELAVLEALKREAMDKTNVLRGSVSAIVKAAKAREARSSAHLFDSAFGGRSSTRNALSSSLNLDDTAALVESVLEGLLPKPEDNSGSSLVVVLGVKFIIDRDFSIWESTFNKASFRVAKTSKKKMTKGAHSTWKVMKCLDLFDGKSHCIEPKRLLELSRDQRVSRLYGLRKTLWNKDKFCETMNTALTGFKNDITREFVFPCWMIPADFGPLIKAARGRHAGKSFILKPTDRGEGNGIVVLDTVRQLTDWKSKFPDNDEIVVQTYLPNPFLINQRKWDMRTYVLVTSVSPLRAYMYNDGLVRFASSKYDKSAKGGGKATSFLTNTSVNKKAGLAVDDLTWPFPKMAAWLRRNGHDADQMWARIEAAVAQMLLGAEPSFVKNFEALRKGWVCANCYQLLGVDIIMDDLMTPRVIEVNGEPSMQLTGEANSHYDSTKITMTRDLVNLVLGHTDGVAKELANDLMELQLEGVSVDFEKKSNCKPRVSGASTSDFCLSENDVEYLAQMKREEMRMGGFRRIYPSQTGGAYSAFIEHLEKAFPRKATKSGTFRLHHMLTRLALISKREQKNAIEENED